jgi:hypothetical protein
MENLLEMSKFLKNGNFFNEISPNRWADKFVLFHVDRVTRKKSIRVTRKKSIRKYQPSKDTCINLKAVG